MMRRGKEGRVRRASLRGSIEILESKRTLHRSFAIDWTHGSRRQDKNVFPTTTRLDRPPDLSNGHKGLERGARWSPGMGEWVQNVKL